MDVGIRELKAHLSDYVSRAADGELIIVTDRGRPVAQLCSLGSRHALDRGIEEGWITPAQRTHLSPAQPVSAACSVADVLDEDRGVTLYVDTSALMKRYIAERDSDVAVELMATDPVLVTSHLTEVEMRRNLARMLERQTLTEVRRRLQADLDAFALVTLDSTTCAEAARIAEETLCRSLDALHLSAARRAGVHTTLLTFDIRQAQSARSIGMSVIGV